MTPADSHIGSSQEGLSPPDRSERIETGSTARSLAKAALEVVGPFLGLALIVVLLALAVFVRDYVRWRKSPASATQSVAGFLGQYENRFLSRENWRTILAQSLIVAVAALGMLVVIISGGIDLSAGTAIALCATVLARALKNDIHWLPAVTLAIGTGVACGVFNGLLVSRLKVVPFIATLGTMMIYLGLAKELGNNTTVRPLERQIPAWLQTLASSNPKHELLLLPNGAWILLLLAVGIAILLHFTSFGRYVFAIGSNEATARICGLNVPMLRIAIYGIGGLFVGIAGLYLFARLNQGNPTSGTGLELKAIAAVVIGGASLSGGRGSIAGTLAGAMVMVTIVSGCTFLEISNPVQDILLGLIIVAAATIDRLRTGGAAG